MRPSICAASLVGVALVLLAVGGCDSTGSAIGVSGTVKLDDAPLPEGRITIYPLESGKPAAVDIVDGNYSMNAEPGDYKVEISRMVEKGAAVTDSDYGIDKELVESLPKRYNAASELRMKVAADGENKIDFALESK